MRAMKISISKESMSEPGSTRFSRSSIARTVCMVLAVAVLHGACGGKEHFMADEKGVARNGLPITEQLPYEGEMPSLSGATDWLNSPKLTTEELRGKVVLVSFWTYTCINWLRADPYLLAWAEKYKDKGLVVVGVHTPEFEFEE